MSKVSATFKLFSTSSLFWWHERTRTATAHCHAILIMLPFELAGTIPQKGWSHDPDKRNLFSLKCISLQRDLHVWHLQAMAITFFVEYINTFKLIFFLVDCTLRLSNVCLDNYVFFHILSWYHVIFSVQESRA